MRIAVFSDLHGNSYACRAILQSLHKEGTFEAVVIAGDLCLGGSDPALCLDLVGELGALAVCGNTESYLRNPEHIPSDELHRKQWDILLPPIQWTNAQLNTRQAAWINALPFERRFSPTGNPDDDLVVVHANPKNLELMIYPPPHEQLNLGTSYNQPDDDRELSETLMGLNARFLAFGHFHYTSTRIWNNHTLVNVAPASMPAIDHDPHTRYTIFTWTNTGWQIIRRWITYDVNQELKALQTCGMPNWQRFASSFG